MYKSQKCDLQKVARMEEGMIMKIIILLDVPRTCDIYSKCKADARSIFSKVSSQTEGGGGGGGRGV